MAAESVATPFQLSEKEGRYALLIALLLGGILRVWPFFWTDFPLGDGGLFYAMSRAISEAGFSLPALVPYPTQSADLPLVYPPLSFGLAALWAKFFSLESAFRILPLAASLALIPAFWRFCRALTPEPFLYGGATLLWACSFPSFAWHITGGGWPRALALCFVLLAFERALVHWKATGQAQKAVVNREILWAAFWLGLAILTHLERARFGVWTLLLMWVFYGRTRMSALQLLAIFTGASLVALPWFALCFSRFGMEPFLSASRSAGDATVVWEIVFRVGFSLLMLRLAMPFVPTWMAGIAALEFRSGFIFLLFPLALAQAGLAMLLVPARWAPVPRLRARLTVLAMMVGVTLFQTFDSLQSLDFLGRDMRQSFAWARLNTSKDARFLITPTHAWARDLPGEWFPVLAHRAAVATVQGAEWLPGSTFQVRLKAHTSLLDCHSWAQILQVARREKWKFDTVLIPLRPARDAPQFGPRIREWARGARADRNWKIVFENSQTLILKRF